MITSVSLHCITVPPADERSNHFCLRLTLLQLGHKGASATRFNLGLGVGQPTCARLTQPAPNDKVIADFRARTTARPSEPVCVTFADLARLQEARLQEAGL